MTTPELIDFIDEDYRIAGLRRLEALNDLARHRSDISPTVTFDFCHITQPTHRKTEELTAEAKKQKEERKNERQQRGRCMGQPSK